jgi:hypothetical protein
MKTHASVSNYQTSSRAIAMVLDGDGLTMTITRGSRVGLRDAVTGPLTHCGILLTYETLD